MLFSSFFLDLPDSKLYHFIHNEKNALTCNKLQYTQNKRYKNFAQPDNLCNAIKEYGLFFSSKALGLIFSATYPWGSFAFFPLSAGFLPLISCQKTAPFDSAELVAGHQSLQKSPYSLRKCKLYEALNITLTTSGN
jgi:hypothetical protein